MQKIHAVQLRLASPQAIRSWSSGEVTQPETVDARGKFVIGGLLCPRIFGPVEDYTCLCGRQRHPPRKTRIPQCPVCKVDFTESRVRRERMGHIELAIPVAHLWFRKHLGTLLDLPAKVVDDILAFQCWVVVNPGAIPLQQGQRLQTEAYHAARDEHGDAFQAQSGGEALDRLLRDLNLDETLAAIRQAIAARPAMKKREELRRRWQTLARLHRSGNRPEWLMLTVLPVLPPDLRPVFLEGKEWIEDDLNRLYGRVIDRNNRLKHLLALVAPEIIVNAAKQSLQEAVDALFDNDRLAAKVCDMNKRPLKSLTDRLKGKKGRFRQNLLGKRVDYSGRSVIVVAPTLGLHQCALPRAMALELFQVFVIGELVRRHRDAVPDDDTDHFAALKQAKAMIKAGDIQAWEALEAVIRDHPVLLNRAPTLHRLGIRAFEPVLTDHKAIGLHPLACAGFNADFDGDQMAVHVPLSIEAQLEARMLMMATDNALSPASGAPTITPSQDMVLGLYYLTREQGNARGEGMIFRNVAEVQRAYDHGVVALPARIQVRLPPEQPDDAGGVYTDLARVETTVGRALLAELLPPGLPFDLINRPLTQKALATLLETAFQRLGARKTAHLAERLMRTGFYYATRSGLSIGIADLTIPDQKPAILAEAKVVAQQIEDQYTAGLLSEDERRDNLMKQRRDNLMKVWRQTTAQVAEALKATLAATPDNSLFMMAHSGARGSDAQIGQLAGMRGLMAKPDGSTLEIPITANFREGLGGLQYFISTHGARKGLVDTALKTANSGYLTRRLADAAQDLTITEADCGASQGLPVSAIGEPGEWGGSLRDRALGRVVAEDVRHPGNGAVVIPAGTLLDGPHLDRLEALSVEQVVVRSPVTCETRYGLCAACYGLDLARGRRVEIGAAVGVIAAQSLGEPSTQLTMRTFHTGGVASPVEDITQGLPQVESLFEAREPGEPAILAEIAGTVSFGQATKRKQRLIITDLVGRPHSVLVPKGRQIQVSDGQDVARGDVLVDGQPNPHDLLRLEGVPALTAYLIQGIQKVYRQQSIRIHDKHIEVIVRQMLRQVEIVEPHDALFNAGERVSRARLGEENERVQAEGGVPAIWRPIVLGIKAAAQSADSFLAAASFERTSEVLAKAALQGESDRLRGLKENLILGRRIPAGTGRDWETEAASPGVEEPS